MIQKYIESYLKECAQTLNPRTIKRRIIALRQYHVLMGLDDPTKKANVVKTMQGIARLHGAPRKQAAAIRLKDLDKMAQHLEQDPSIFNIRNRALILLGYFIPLGNLGVGIVMPLSGQFCST